MSLEQGTQLKNGKVINSTSEENTSSSNVMAESNIPTLMTAPTFRLSLLKLGKIMRKLAIHIQNLVS